MAYTPPYVPPIAQVGSIPSGVSGSIPQSLYRGNSIASMLGQVNQAPNTLTARLNARAADAGRALARGGRGSRALGSILGRPSVGAAGAIGGGIIGYNVLDAAQSGATSDMQADRYEAAKIGVLGGPLGVASTYLGQLGYQAGPWDDDRNLGNVVTNIGRWLGFVDKTGGGLLSNDNLQRLEAAGITPSQLVSLIDDENADRVLGTALIDKVDGATVDDDGRGVLTGPALEVVEAWKAADDGEVGALLRDLRDANITTDEGVVAAIQAYSAAKASTEDGGAGLDEDAARLAAVSAGAQLTDAAEAEADWFARSIAAQEAARAYMAPVTGGMRQRADAQYASISSMLSGLNLPPGMAESFMMQADATRQQQMAVADAYDAQINISPQVAAYQDYRSQMDSLAAQLMQSAMQEQMLGGGQPLSLDQLPVPTG